MSLVKISDSEKNQYGVTLLPNVPPLTATQLKAKFEEKSDDLIIPKFNELSDQLTAAEGADELGARFNGEDTTIQGAINTLKGGVEAKMNIVDYDSDGDGIVNGADVAGTLDGMTVSVEDLNDINNKIKNGVKTVKVGETEITATGEDTLELVAGSNIDLVPDAANKKVTIRGTGGGGGVDRYDELLDVLVTSPSEGQIPVYDDDQGKWVNVTPALNTLSDVDITTPSDGESLVYDGSHAKWKNKETIDALARALQNEFGVHNLMPFVPYSDLTSHNITPTIRPNGTVRYNTSAAIDANTILGISAPTSATTNSSTKYVLKAGSYKFVVKTSSALSVDMYVAVQNCDNDTAIAVANSGTEAVVPFTLSADTSILVYSYFAAGQTLSNFDVQAFIILDSDTDTDYLPFALPNSKLTEAVYKNKISDANTDNNDGMLRYYHVIGVSGNHAPQNGSAYLMLEFGYAEKFVIQLAFDVSNDFIYMRRKGNNASWPTTGTYGWVQIYPVPFYTGTNTTATSISSSSNTNISSIANLPAGKYRLTGSVNFGQNATGWRSLTISTTSGSDYHTWTAVGNSTQRTDMQYTEYMTLSSAKTVYLVAYQNSGSSLSISSIQFHAERLS